MPRGRPYGEQRAAIMRELATCPRTITELARIIGVCTRLVAKEVCVLVASGKLVAIKPLPGRSGRPVFLYATPRISMRAASTPRTRPATWLMTLPRYAPRDAARPLRTAPGLSVRTVRLEGSALEGPDIANSPGPGGCSASCAQPIVIPEMPEAAPA
jgi:hypothetical protein